MQTMQYWYYTISQYNYYQLVIKMAKHLQSNSKTSDVTLCLYYLVMYYNNRFNLTFKGFTL